MGVSIPLRYADNRVQTTIAHLTKNVSIPLRYADNGSQRNYHGLCQVVSIPLRYADNEIYNDIRYSQSTVSIPLRYADNMASSALSSDSIRLFQFLLGTLITQPGRRSSPLATGFNSS